MVVIVWADSKRLEMSQEDLIFLISVGMPTTLKTSDRGNTKMSLVNIIPGQANINSKNVLQSEYQVANLKLRPESIYFSLSYTIEMTVSRDCIDCADC